MERPIVETTRTATPRDPGRRLDAACRTACALLDAPFALAALFEDGEIRLAGRCGDGLEALTPKTLRSLAARLSGNECLVVPDLRAATCGPIALDGIGARFCAAVPLRPEAGSHRGFLCVLDAAPRPDIGTGQVGRLHDVAHLAEGALRAWEAERRLAEREAQVPASQAGTRIGERTARFGHWRLDLETQALAWSAGFAGIFGRARPEPVGLDAHLDDYHPDDREAVRASLAGAMADPDRLDGDEFGFRARILRPDGEVRHVSVHGLTERAAGGRPTALHGVCLDVSDVTRSERELDATTSLLRATLEAMDQGLVMTDADDRIRVHNRHVAAMMGVPEELLRDGAPFSAVRAYQTAQGEFAHLPDRLRRWLECGDPEMRIGDYERERPDGTVVQVSTLPLATGGLVRTFTDVTAQRAAERALQASERRYRLIAENASDIIILSDLDTTRRYVSPAVRAILGYAPEELIGTRPLDFVHPDDAEDYRRILEAVGAGRAQRGLTLQRYRHRDGRWVWLELSFGHTHDPVSGAADGFVATLRDVSARVAEEEAAREGAARERALAEARLREALVRADFTTATSAAILAQLAEGVIVTDAAGRITLVNAAAAAIHGVARLDVEPDAYSDTYHLFTEDGVPHPPLDLPLARAVRGETVRDARWRVRRPDGTEILTIGSAQPLLSPDGAQIGAVLTVRDDTAREAAERRLRGSEASLRDLNATLAQRVDARTREAEAARALAETESRAKSEFLASMSHEIRTPLNGVIGYADLLLDEPAIGAHVRQYGERIRSAGSALLTVVNDILDFSKIEAGQVEIATRPFALATLVDNTVSIVRGLAESKGLALGVALDPTIPPWLGGDEDRLRQVLLNLLNNAIKFTPGGRVDLRVDLRPDAGGAGAEAPVRVRFTVSDTGVGIPADKRDRLFRRFSQVDGSYRRAHEGTGLGLAICKSLVELMGGAVGVESEEGRGSSFRFEVSLPREAPPRRSARDQAHAAARAGRRVLLAEDVPLNQDLACALLQAAGHTVDVVANGAEAVSAVQTGRYDLVLMDVQMPVMDGVSATRHIRALDHPAASLPIVALTANVLPQQVAEFRAAGMTDHVGKPFQRAALLDAIDRWTETGREPAPVRRSVENATLDALARAVGRDRVGELLATLAEELDARFGSSAPAPDRTRIAQDAHAMITATGMLGFPELSGLCREVEEACRSGADYAPLLGRLCTLTTRTIAEIAATRAA